MKLKYQAEWKSVKEFSEFEIPSFVFLTGKNGSGKTHILEAIKKGNIQVDDIKINEILHLNYLDFASVNFQVRTNYADKTNAWDKLNNPNDIISQLKNIENEINEDKEIIEKVAIEKSKPIIKLQEDDFTEEQKPIFDKLVKYVDTLMNSLNQENYINDDIAQSVFESIISKSSKFLSSLNETAFKSNYQKSAIGGRRILSDLSNLFFEYHVNKQRNILDKAKSKPSLNNRQFSIKYGNPPWKLIRGILKGFNFGFDVSDPEQEEIDPFTGSFQITFKNLIRSNKIIPFDDLSSGERILITLVNAIYTSNRRGELPKLILLDEIDGPLNPSIIEKFISYIENNFVAKNVHMIIATHSPTTVAFAPEGSVYITNTENRVPLISTSNTEAIKSLSEGFVTLADILNIQSVIASNIMISEGKNYKYLNKAKEYYGNRLDLDILQIRSLGSGELRNLFDFIRRFNNTKKFVFVWDHDYRFIKDDIQNIRARDLSALKTSANSKNRIYIFEDNTTGAVSEGIENLIEKGITTGYTGTLTNEKPLNKDHFEKFILNRNIKSDFKNFKKLFTFIRSNNTSNL